MESAVARLVKANDATLKPTEIRYLLESTSESKQGM